MENKLTNLEKEAEEYANNFRFIVETDSWFNNKCNSFIAGANSNHVKQQIIKGKIEVVNSILNWDNEPNETSNYAQKLYNDLLKQLGQ